MQSLKLCIGNGCICESEYSFWDTLIYPVFKFVRVVCGHFLCISDSLCVTQALYKGSINCTYMEFTLT